MTRKFLTLMAVSVLSFGLSHGAMAQEKMSTVTTLQTEQAVSTDMTDGEIRKVDMENKKITIKHGEIKNLDMPGMTMVFRVRDPAVLEKVKAGDKVRFKAEKSEGAIVVTDIQTAK
jgi:Cu(I)/Ag(I) efflux system protein CusF